MARIYVAVLVSCLLALAAAQSNDTIVLQSGACTAFEMSPGTKYHYEASLQSGSLPTGCNSSSVRISKLYLQDTCINSRDNSLEFSSVQRVSCQTAQDTSTSTCQAVFNNGPSGGLLNVSTINKGQTFDSGDICGTSKTAYIYVQNICRSSVTVQIKFKTSSYAGTLGCATVAGRSISAAGIAMIVIGCTIAVLLLVFLCCCCCCRRR